MNSLVIQNLSKNIKQREVLVNVNASMESGNIYGLIGKNGSGKTMLIRSIAGLMRPTTGNIIWNNLQLYADIDFIPKIGIIIENIGLCQELCGFENLKILSKVNKTVSDETIYNTIIRVGLDPQDSRPIKKYSLGMKQKIVLAQALFENPDLILLDEPTNALDEESVRRVHKIIKEESERGAIVLITSHHHNDIDNLCNEVYYMENGRLSKKGII